MPAAPDPVTSTPDQSWQPYDATAEGSVGKWKTVTAGPANSSGEASSEWEGGPGGWQQT